MVLLREVDVKKSKKWRANEATASEITPMRDVNVVSQSVAWARQRIPYTLS